MITLHHEIIQTMQNDHAKDLMEVKEDFQSNNIYFISILNTCIGIAYII